MLYKKYHRQYVREFKKGRKFKYDGRVYQIHTGIHIVMRVGSICVDSWCLIYIYDGRFIGRDRITLLD